MKFNKEQKVAVFSDQNLSLTANAGSGKTYVLTQRYLHLVFNDHELRADPSKIVAITFTRKAASEMKSKIINELDNRIGLEDEPQRLNELKKIRRNLNKARIQTINSFCNDLIEDFPDQSGLITFSNEISETELNNFLSKRVNEIILEKSKSQSKDLKFILDYLNLNNIRTIILDLLQNNSLEFDKLIELYKKDTNEIIDSFNAKLFNYFKINFDYLINTIKYILNNHTVSKLTQNAKDSLSLAKKHIFNIEQNYNEDQNSFFSLKFDFNEFVKIKYSGKKFVTFFKNDIDSAFEEALINISNLFNSLKFKEYDEIQIKIGKILFNWSLELEKDYKNYKFENNVVEYNDQLKIALELLNKDQVLEKVSNSIKYLMIDEFQDTDYVQSEIVKKLISKNRTKLFIVGDEKQSIYGFRNAEIKLFKEIRELIRNINKNNTFAESENKFLSGTVLDQNQMLGDIELPVSYRMNKYLATFVNDISSSIFQEDNAYAAKNTPLICGKNIYNDKLKPYIEFLTVTEEKMEAEYVANRLSKLINSGLKPDKIGVLARTNSQLNELAKELTKCNIPIELHTKESFYDIQEVDDIVTYFKIVNGDTNNFNLTKLLRSYFFGLADTDILNLYGLNDNLFEALIESDVEYFNEIYRIINDNINSKGRSDLIESLRLMVSSSYWKSITKKAINCDTINSNLNKFFDVLYENIEQGNISVSRFLENAKKGKESNYKYGEQVSLAKGKVNLMTMHSAKGLQFECVVLYSTNKTTNRSSLFKISNDFGLAFKLNRKELYKNKTPLNYLISHQNSLEELEEMKRLLYVALTRAEEKLIISADVSSKNDELNINKNSFLELILDALNIDLKNNLISKNNDIFIQIDNQNRVIENIEYEIQISNKVDQEKVNKIDEISQKIDFSDRLIEPIKLENITATKLNYLKNDPNIFRERYIYGMPESDSYQFKGIAQNPNNNEDHILGTKKGILVHAALEHIKDFVINGEINDLNIDQIINDIFKEEIDENDKLKIFTKETVYAVLESEFIKNKYNLLKKVVTEAALELPFGDDQLTGLIDLYLFNENGELEIWDWKTNNINKNEINKTAEFYKPQMLFYSYLLSFFVPTQEIIKARLLFTKFAGFEVKDNDWIYTFEFNKNQIKDFEKDLEENFKKLKELHFS